MRKIIIYLVLLLVISSCSIPSDPGLPTWETTLEFYIMNDSYEMKELAEEDSAIVYMEVDGDSLLFIQETESETHEFELDPTESTTEIEEAEIGSIELPEADNVSGVMTLIEFANSSNLTLPPDGQSGVVPTFDFEDIDLEMEPVEEFLTVTIEEGSCSMTITNNMGITLGNYQEGNPLVMQLIHDDGNEEIIILEEEFLNENISGDGSVYNIPPFDLAGKRLYSEMFFRISGGSRGTEGSNTALFHENELIVEVDFADGMTAVSANAKIAEQTITEAVEMDFDSEDRYRLASAQIYDNGNGIDIHIENSLDLDFRLNIDIPALFLDGSSESFNEVINIPRSGGIGMYSVTDTTISLGNAILQQTGAELLESIVINAEAHIDSTEDYRFVESTDFFSITAEIGELEFESVQGIVTEQEQEDFEDNIELDIEYPFIEDEDALNFAGYSHILLDVDMQNTTVPLELTVDIQGSNDEGETFQLLDLETNEIPVIDIPLSSAFQIDFTSEGYNLNDLISILPDDISFNVGINLGSDTEMINYHRGDVMEVDILFESELNIQANTWIIPTEDGEIQINEEEVELEEEQYDAFRNAQIELTYTNTTGLEVTGNILLGPSDIAINEYITQFDETDYPLADVIVIPKLMDTSETGEQVATINIGQDKLDYLLEDITYIASRLKLESDEASPIGGAVNIQAKVKVTVEVSNDLIEGEE